MTTVTHQPINLAGLRWADKGRVASFAASRPGFGVQVIATGEVLSKDGVRPAVWGTRSAAATVAEYATGMPQYTPVQVFRA